MSGRVVRDGTPRLLVVEDEYLIARHLRMLLQDMGCEVIGPVGDLSQAEELAGTERLDAAVLDIKLAGGAQIYPVADVLSARGVPFAFVTGYNAIDVPERYRGVRLLGKPATVADFRATVAALLAQRPKKRAARAS
jgi:DNA-binding response OmpR family regulator